MNIYDVTLWDTIEPLLAHDENGDVNYDDEKHCNNVACLFMQ